MVNDELSDTISIEFRVFRRAVTEYRKVFVVILGTNSSLSVLIPPAERDPSARLLSRNPDSGYSHHLPFVVCGTTDVMIDRSPKLSLPLSTYEMFRQGRPLWASGPFKLPQQGQELIQYALEKLNAGLAGNVSSPNTCIAALSVRLSLTILPTAALTFDLVANHMATLLAVDLERRFALITYPSEPILAEAAARIWNNDRWLERIALPILVHQRRLGVVSPGDAGEVLARLLLLMAMDFCIRVLWKYQPTDQLLFSSPVKVQAFLTALSTMDGVESEFKNDSRVVSFTHFVPLDKSPTRAVLRRLASRCAAAIFPINHRGADLIIPLLDGGDVTSYILVQVKNYQDGKVCSIAANEEMLPSNVFLNSDDEWMKNNGSAIRVFMQLGGNSFENSRSAAPNDRPTRATTMSLRKTATPTFIQRGVSNNSYTFLKNATYTLINSLQRLRASPRKVCDWIADEAYRDKFSELANTVKFDESKRESASCDLMEID
jgi:hypothetical protein